MKKKPQLYKFSEIKNRLQTLEAGKSYIKPFVTSKVSDTMCGGLNFLNQVSRQEIITHFNAFIAILYILLQIHSFSCILR
mgnify:CR=1 FL=1